MKYLVFDIECSNGNDICSFGYVIADEEYNVIAQEDILINPESKFVLTNRAGTKGISLAYKPEDFYAAPTFPHYYEKIRAIIENPEYAIIGFAISNDAGFLRKVCERYSLPHINFEFFDTQRLDAKLHGDGEIRSLAKVIAQYDIVQDDENILHKSDDDAFFTLEIFRKMAEELSLSGNELIAANPDCSGESKFGTITYDGLPVGNADKMRKKDTILFRKHCEELKKAHRGVKGVLSGKKICFARSFESKAYRKMLVLASLIYESGGRLVPVKNCNAFVDGGAENAQSELARANGAEIITLSELLTALGVDEETLEKRAGEVNIVEWKKRADDIVLPPQTPKK